LSGFQEKTSYSRYGYYWRSYHCPDEKKIALEHLDFAIREVREMKMQPSLERALRRKEILKA